jgi:hypothetical protein
MLASAGARIDPKEQINLASSGDHLVLHFRPSKYTGLPPGTGNPTMLAMRSRLSILGVWLTNTSMFGYLRPEFSASNCFAAFIMKLWSLAVLLVAAPGITRPLAYLQTIEIAQRESRAPTGGRSLPGKARPQKSNSPQHARKP